MAPRIKVGMAFSSEMGLSFTYPSSSKRTIISLCEAPSFLTYSEKGMKRMKRWVVSFAGTADNVQLQEVA
ncbi:hypothetical protein [Candidatus Methanodesulfokora washburnensis]|uniref:Uncharacterized protein n=1 Tax=Candidatus Methanodesulfokora washburnensis TaxID=2478471 RepID=A0A520KHA7_9CREN|nr:hypothetical protein [Candidatus Methanodesulfokores washburnensis]RZN58189.1 MAG: hypothetical protein EF810_07850 [Candidatus Methanodesulfokores washburnensis]